MSQLQNISDTCGYTDYLDKFVTYPPKGQLPLPAGTAGTFNVVPSCRIHSPVQRAVTTYVRLLYPQPPRLTCIILSIRLNPVFDVYRISDTWPNLCRLFRRIKFTAN